MIFGLTYRSFMPQLKDILNFGAAPMPELFNVSAGLMVAVFALMFLMTLYVVDRTNAHRTDKVNGETQPQASAD